jgi:membrane-bound metal-dependent hydrolase YbcI (DUF457 family)
LDPISHATFGVTLVEALGARTERDATTIVRGATIATVLGALSPDIDAALMPFGWDRYLRVHEIATHTIVGSIGCGLATAGLVWFFIRTRYGTLALCASLAALSHVLLDLLSSARLKPGWPLVDGIVSLPVVAMADPWLLTLCIVGALLIRVSRDGPRAASIGLGLIAAFLAAKATLGFVAVASYREAVRRTGDPVVARVVEAEWASMTAWRVSDATASQLRVWRTSVRQPAQLELAWPRMPESELARQSRGFSTVKNFLAAHELAFWVAIPSVPGTRVRPTTSTAPATVLWSDIRFCWRPDLLDLPSSDTIIELPEHGPIACALWFGGEIGADGRVVKEIVRIGSFTQTRQPHE